MFRRLKGPTLMTKVGWGIAAGLTTLALLPWAHVAITLGAIVLGVAMAVVMYLATTRPRIDKVVNVPISDVPKNDRVRYEEALRVTLAPFGTVESCTVEGSRLELAFRTDRELATVHRLVRRALGRSVHVIGVEGGVVYSALAPGGAAEVRLSGQVMPDVAVHIPGLDEPVMADSKGRFSQEVPYAAVKKHASRGKIRATYTHGGKQRHVDIDLGT